MEEMRIVLKNAGRINPEKIEDYIAVGGYEELKKARTGNRKELIDMLEGTGKLRGRGGAGFPTGMKWSSAYQVHASKKYVICNADEGEPGTFKDRVIMQNDPHRLIEGMLICAYAIGAKDCYIYCRGEYHYLIKMLRNAIEQARGQGLLDGITMRVHGGAGAYVCGEETALIESLEGKRGEPRLKPPFPVVAGFNACPTVVNNVETFATIPSILEMGCEKFNAIGSVKYPGTKIFSLSGDVKNTGCYELSTDCNLKDIIYDLGGGAKKGHKVKAIQVGGSSCAFMKPEQLDITASFDDMRSAGFSLGSGAILVIDETHNMADVCLDIARFFEHESCGKCIPCREGTFRVREILERLAEGRGKKEDLQQIRNLSELMAASCFCPLGQSATLAVGSALKLFEEDFLEKLAKEEG